MSTPVVSLGLSLKEHSVRGGTEPSQTLCACGFPCMLGDWAWIPSKARSNSNFHGLLNIIGFCGVRQKDFTTLFCLVLSLQCCKAMPSDQDLLPGQLTAPDKQDDTTTNAREPRWLPSKQDRKPSNAFTNWPE